jgi:hypothetical protein
LFFSPRRVVKKKILLCAHFFLEDGKPGGYCSRAKGKGEGECGDCE